MSLSTFQCRVLLSFDRNGRNFCFVWVREGGARWWEGGKGGRGEKVEGGNGGFKAFRGCMRETNGKDKAEYKSNDEKKPILINSVDMKLLKY
jgi:hypothetical protein